MTRMMQAVLVVMLVAGSAAAEEVQSVGRVNLNTVLKFTYTSRDRHERTGVSAISSASLSWLELDINGELGEHVSYALDFVASNSLWQDPITGTGTPAGRAGPGELGRLGVRRAEVKLTGYIPTLSFRLGTMMPGWGAFQDRKSWEWEFVDLPLIYTSPAFARLGWQNTGLGLQLTPAEWLLFQLNYMNGYFPDGEANSESLLPDGSLDRSKAWVGRLRLVFGPVSLWGAYFTETWEEDIKGGPQPENQEASAWLGGAEVRLDRFWALVEWMSLSRQDYQLRLNGEWSDLTATGGHVSLGYWILDDWQALVRWEWIDPNTANTRKTFQRSRFDQISQWTVGVNYRLGEHALIMVNFVMPEEEGHEVNIPKGKMGGKYQNVVNNYFRLQLQLWQ